MRIRSCLPGRLLALVLLAAGVPAPVLAAAITGICPDGSIYVVQRAEQVPCSRSKQVEPHEVPPLRPEYLPTPYPWQVWSQGQNPNNPYNLIDDSRAVRGLEEHTAAGEEAEAPPVSSAPAGGDPPEAERLRPEVGPLDLGLSDEDLRSLFLIVELSQEQQPVQFARNTADGRGVQRVAMAYSAAFEAKLREAWASRGGLGARRVLVFTALSKRPEAFYANFTFVQGHLTYQPDAANPGQLGILQGRLGQLEGDEAVLGYIVLPETMDLSAALDVYWNDRHAAARFQG